jgi:diguanylate cyclase (GGDEF)-like protein
MRGLPAAAVAGDAHLPWWALVGGFLAAEVCVVHVHIRGDAHSFSLSEVPLVVGLFCTAPRGVLLAQLLGAGLALVLHRRQSLQKLIFNLAQFSLSTAVAVVVFHAFPQRSPLTAAGWAAAAAAALASATVGVMAITAVISLVQGRVQLDRFTTVTVLVGVGAGSNASLGILGAWLVWRDPSGLWLLFLPAAALLIAYRAFVGERQRLDGLHFIQESARMLHATSELDDAVLTVLRHACEMVRADAAEVVLFDPAEDGTATRWRVSGHGAVHSLESVTLGPFEQFLTTVAGKGDATTIRASREEDSVRALLEERGLRDAIVAGVRAERGPVGVMVLSNRLGEVTSFDLEDARMIETLARHLSIALENGHLERSLGQLRALQEELREQAFTDALTGLANRVLLTERTEHALRRGTEPTAVLFIDLDDFKTVNDSLGHAAGDELLRAVAGRLRGCIRPRDTAARIGGDEFAILLEDSGGLGEAMTVAERVLASMSSPFHVQASSVHVRASIGIAMGLPREKTADDLLGDADLAMYTAKFNGKGTFEIFEPRMRDAVQQRHTLKTRLRRAVVQGEFVVHYQPIVALHDQRVAGAEALVRWETQENGMVMPDAFIPLAEETGLINEIGAVVLERACRDARRWSARDLEARVMSINVSPRQLTDPCFVDVVTEALARHALPASSLMIEITETTLMRDAAADVEKLQALRRLGVRVAIDDFGTGYSSMSYLRRFPVDVLKVAKPFVDGVATDGADAGFTEAIVRLGQCLGVQVIAEGIGDADQLATLQRMGCDLGQGFLFSPALDADRFDRLQAAPPWLGHEVAGASALAGAAMTAPT